MLRDSATICAPPAMSSCQTKYRRRANSPTIGATPATSSCQTKYRRQAEHPPRQRLPHACCATAQRYALHQRRHPAKQNTAVRRKKQKLPHACCAAAQRYAPPPATWFYQTKNRRQAKKTKTTSRMLRGSATICAPLQRRHSVTCAVYSRRDDRAMMTKKELGDVNSRSRASQLF